MNQTPDPNAMPGSNPAPAGPPPGPTGWSTPPTGPMGYTPQPPPAPNKGRRTGIIILVILGILVVGGIGYVALNRDKLSGGVDALQVGDCIDDPASTDTITEVQHQPCNTPHDGEVFAVLTNPAGPDEPYPVVSGFDDYIQTNCVPLFESYTGRSWDTETDLTISYLHPTLDGWTGDQHDRGFSCYVLMNDASKLTASVHLIGASPLPVAP